MALKNGCRPRNRKRGGTLEFAQPLTNSTTGRITGRGTLMVGSTGLGNEGTAAFSGGLTDLFGNVSNAAGAKIITSGGGTTTFWHDVTNNAGAEIRTSTRCASVFIGNVYGAGSFTGEGTVYFEGEIHPGSSPAEITFGGDVVLTSTSRLAIELGGTAPGAEYDRLSIAGHVALGGTLDVSLIPPFRPVHNDQFTILTFGSRSGDFAQKNGLDLGSRLQLVPDYTLTSLVLTTVQGRSGSWRLDQGGLASVPGNWTGVIPQGVGDVATFGPVITEARIVSIDAPRIWSGMIFNNSHRYVIAGPQAINLVTAGGHAAIRVDNLLGEGHTIAAAVNVLSDLDVVNSSADELTFSGHLNNSLGRQINVAGAGTVVIAGPLSHAGNIAVGGGTLRYEIDSGSVAIGEAATLRIAEGAAVEAGGTIDPFTDSMFPAQHVAVVNDSTAGGFLVTGGQKEVASLTGAGKTTVEAGATLTASYIRQASVELSGTAGHPARLVIRPSGGGGGGVVLGSSFAAAQTPGGTEAVPEPGTTALATIAILALVACRLLRRRPIAE